MAQFNRSFPNLQTLHERLTFAYNNRSPKKSQTEIAKTIGISQPTFSALLSGKNQTSVHLDEIIKELNTDHQWIITGIPSESAISGSLNFASVPLLKNYAEHINTRSKSLVSNTPSDMQLDIKVLRNRYINFHDTFYIPMPDRGMELVIKENSSVFADSSQILIEDGCTYVVSHGGILLVRQLFNTPLGGVKLTAINPMFEGTTLDLDQQENQAFVILGRVFTVINYY